MQGNSGNVQKIIRTKPHARREGPDNTPERGPKWVRTDKRAAFSQK